MAVNRRGLLAVPAAAALLLWPALWNRFPIVFADTGTYLSQAIDHYAGWDRPMFYSLFMLPLHATVTVWPVIVVQALLTAWVLSLVCRGLAPDVSGWVFVGTVGVLSIFTWLPWIVSELMPDLFTPLLVLVLCLLVCVPERLQRVEQAALAGLATFMIASQLSSLPLSCVLLVVSIVAKPILTPGAGYVAACLPGCVPFRTPLAYAPAGPAVGPAFAEAFSRSTTTSKGGQMFRHPADEGADQTNIAAGNLSTRHFLAPTRRWLLVILPPTLAIFGLCSVNLAGHGRFAVSPFGNVFLLARVIYDGPGMAILRRDCPTADWKLCPFLDSFPATSDDFLWTEGSPLGRAGGPKAVSRDAGAIIEAALIADPAGEARAALRNTWEQLTRFDSGDGLNPWPDEVSPAIERDFPAREQAAYRSARQQAGTLAVPSLLGRIHVISGLAGVMFCMLLLPVAVKRRATCAGFLLAILLALPVSAAITGSLSSPHDRYQARIMWLPPFIAVISVVSMRRRPVAGEAPVRPVLGWV